MSLLKSKVFKPLKDGHHSVKLKSFVEVNGKDGKDNYIQLTYLFPNGRELVHNLFASSFPIAMSQLNLQLNPEGDDDTPIDAGVLLQTAHTLEHIDIYISHFHATSGKNYRNFNFLPPMHAPSASTDTPPSGANELTEDDF